MKAIRFTHYGSPDVMRLEEVETPTPTENQVLIRVVAAAANPLDWHKMRADPALVRFEDGLLAPKNPRMGADVAGYVEAVGSKVTRFKVGDAVFGDGATGSFAEYVTVNEERLVSKPEGLSFEAAAAAPVAAITAYQGLVHKGKVAAGQRVLVNGASGGVGSYAVQIAKAFGAHVTAVCSARNVELVRSIGADEVIDYTQTDFTRTGKTFDLIYDAIGNRAVGDLRRALTPQGKCVVGGFTTLWRMMNHVVRGGMVSKQGGQQIGIQGTANPNPKDLEALKELLASGKVVSVIDRRYPLQEAAEAIRYLETGRARGKVIIQVAGE